MIFQLTVFAVLGLDLDLDQYIVIHFDGNISLRIYSKESCRKFVEIIKTSQQLAGRISKEELLAIEDVISNSKLQEEICAKDVREAHRVAMSTLNEIFNSVVDDFAEKPEFLH